MVVSDKIESAADLKGKTFAIPSNQSSHNILLNDLLAGAGLAREDVNVVQLPPAEMPSSLAGKAIDGYCVAEPFGAQAVVSGVGHVLCKSEELWENSICCALVLRDDFIDSHGEDAALLAEYYNQAGDALTDEKSWLSRSSISDRTGKCLRNPLHGFPLTISQLVKRTMNSLQRR